MSDQSLRDALEKLAEDWRYKGEFGWGPWQAGEGPDPEGAVLDEASAELRKLLDAHPAEPVGVTTHLIADGEAVTSCCRRNPFELPRTERVTIVRSLANCSQSVGVSDEAVEAARVAYSEACKDGWHRDSASRFRAALEAARYYK